MVNQNDIHRLSLRLLDAMPASLGWARRKRLSDEVLKEIRVAFTALGKPIAADLVSIAWKSPRGPLSFAVKPV